MACVLGDLERLFGAKAATLQRRMPRWLLDGLGWKARCTSARWATQGGQKCRVLLAQALFESPALLWTSREQPGRWIPSLACKEIFVGLEGVLLVPSRRQALF